MKRLIPVLGCLFIALSCSTSGQTYRNLVNARFNTVASGPMQALIVDVSNPNDRAAVMRAVAQKVNEVRAARQTALMREMDFLRQRHLIRPGSSPGIPEIVILRQNGRLALPLPKITRAGGLSLAFPATGTTGSWTAEQQNELKAIWDTVYPEMLNVYGDPSWSGTVTLINGDNITPIISDRNALSGGVFNATTKEIIFAVYNAPQTKVFNLTQMMALAFRGPSSISYDIWERGMARAATLVVVRNVLPLLEPRLYPSGTIDVADPLWHALDRYDLLNQAALGNDRFFPVSKVSDPVDQSSLAGMLVPRLQMSGSAWLKAAEENPGVLKQFNDAYYAALVSNPNLRNSVPDLKALLAGFVPNVEGLAFNDWYQQQYILDTSVTQGDKLYAWSFALRPDLSTDDDFALGIVLVYYRTGFDTNGNSDETNKNGVCYPIYWDNTYQFRLFLAAQYERVDILNGLGTVAPTFFNTLGGNDPQSRMRITIDLPVNSSTVRLYTAPRDMGKTPAPNNFWGAIVGADTGAIQIDFENGVTANTPVQQGSFGIAVDPTAFTQPRRATVTFTDSQGQKTIRKVNTGYREYISVLYAQPGVQSLTNTLHGGLQMISFPIVPFRPKASDALLNPANDQPLFNDTNLLLARWNQLLSGDDKYQIYPNLGPLQPGQGFWSNLEADTTIKINGRLLSNDSDYSTGLVHGWNQIGDPYLQPVSINNLQFQYLADNVPQDLAGAISKGWLVAGTLPGSTDPVVVYGFDPASGYFKATQLEAWKGYWIRVLVSEGLTMTAANPTKAVRSVRPTRAVSSAVPGWSLPITLSGPRGLGCTAYLGMSDRAQSGFDPKMDILRPPAFSRAAPSVAFPHTDWDENSGDYFSDIHRTGSRDPWQITIYTPEPNQTYRLGWSNLVNVPRSTRLVLVDTANGRRQYLQTTSAYSFNSGTAAVRRFQIIPEDRSRTSLRVFNVVTRQNRAASGGSVQIGFDLSAGAEVTAEIRSADGRVIRRLGATRAATSGTNQVMWDTRDDRTVSVASGSYLIKITARTPEGESATAIQPILVLR